MGSQRTPLPIPPPEPLEEPKRGSLPQYQLDCEGVKQYASMNLQAQANLQARVTQLRVPAAI